jgi:hypothetical protein
MNNNKRICNMYSHKSLLLFLTAAVTMVIVNFSARAALIPRGNGMVYDDVQHLTWLQDANYAATTGYAAGGYMSWGIAYDWAQTVTVGGFSDWRMPSTAEFQNMFMSANGLGNATPSIRNTGPFTNVQFSLIGGYWTTNFFMLATPDGLTAEYYYYNDTYLGWSYQIDGGGAYFVWPVRSGDIAHPTNTITIGISPAGTGTAVGAGKYPASFTTTLTAAPNNGYIFQSWTVGGQVVSTANPYVFLATNDTALVANFSLPPNPPIQMSSSGAHSFTLVWPTNYAGFTLQQNSSLRTTNWTTAVESVGIVGVNYQVTISTTNGSRFFRLRHP